MSTLMMKMYSFSQLIKIYKSLKHILNEMGASQIELNFCIYHQNPGQTNTKTIELIPGGENIKVKDTNKEEYAKLM